MPIINMTTLRQGLTPGQRLIGLDPGAKRVGIALSDVSLMIASPHSVIPRGRLAGIVETIGTLSRREGAGGLVIGLPLSMDGSLGPAAQAARDWARAVSEATALPAALWDERLSSAAVNRVLVGEADLSRRRRAALVDAMAAAYTLQGALDACRDGNWKKEGP